MNRRKEHGVVIRSAIAKGLIFVATFTLLCGLIYGVLHADQISTSEYVQGVMTMAIGNVIGWISTMIAYEFGSTRTSAVKDTTISNLAQPQAPTVTEETKVKP